MIDRHHILFNGREWSLRPQSKQIRETRSLVIPMERELHNELHRQSPAVPLLGYHALARVSSLFESSGKTMEDIGRLQKAIEESTEHPRAHPVERELGQLAIVALDVQKPFIRLTGNK